MTSGSATTQKRMKVKMHFFFSLGTSQSLKLIPNAVFNKVLYNNNSKKNRGAICQEKWGLKNGFPVVFSKCVMNVVGCSFFAKKKSENAEHPKICLSFGGSMPEAQIKRCPLIRPLPVMQFGFRISKINVTQACNLSRMNRCKIFFWGGKFLL